MEKKEVIAKNLEFYRKKASLSQLDLARKLNYSNKNISKWEKAETTPSIFVLQEIAKLYGIKVDDLLVEKAGQQEEEKPKNRNVVDEKKKKIFRLSMLLLANAIMFVVGTVAVYVLGLVNEGAFEKWLIYLYLTPLVILSILIYIRVIYKHVNLICMSLLGWLICVSFYVSFLHVENIALIFILGASYQFLAIVITILVNLHLTGQMQSVFEVLFKHKKDNKTINDSNTKEANLENVLPHENTSTLENSNGTNGRDK